MTQFGRRVSNLGISLSLAVSIPLQLATAAVVRTFGDIEDAALDAASLMKGAGKDMGRTFANMAMNMSLTLPFNPDEILKGVAEIERAGFLAKEAWGMFPIIAKFAVAGNADLTASSEKVVGVLSAYGMRASDTTTLLANLNTVTNTLAITANETNATFEEMVDAMAAFAPQAKAMGIDIFEAAAMLGQLHQGLIKGRKAGTWFDIAMRDIAEAFEKNKDVWQGKAKIQLFENGQMKSSIDIFKQLQAALAGLNDEQRLAALRALELPIKSRRAALAFLGTSQAAEELEKQLKSGGNEVERMYNLRMEGLNNQLSLLSNQFSRAAFHLGQAFVPVVTKASGFLATLLYRFSSLSAETQRSISYWALFGAALGPVLIVVGMLISSVQLIISPFRALFQLVLQLAIAFGIWTYSILATSLALTTSLVMGIGRAVIQMGKMARWIVLMWVHNGLWAGSVMMLRRAYLLLFGAMALLQFDRMIKYIIGVIAAVGWLEGSLIILTAAWRAMGISAFIAWLMALSLPAIIGIAIVGLVGYLLYLIGAWDWLKSKLQSFWNWLVGAGSIATEAVENQIKGMTEAMSTEMDNMMKVMDKKMGEMNAQAQEEMQAQQKLHARLFEDADGIDTLEEKKTELMQAWFRGLVDQYEYQSQLKMITEQAAAKEKLDAADPNTNMDLKANEKDKGIATHGFSATTYGSEDEYRARIKGQQDAMLKVNQQQLAENKKQNSTLVAVNQGIKALKDGMGSGIVFQPVNS